MCDVRAVEATTMSDWTTQVTPENPWHYAWFIPIGWDGWGELRMLEIPGKTDEVFIDREHFDSRMKLKIMHGCLDAIANDCCVLLVCNTQETAEIYAAYAGENLPGYKRKALERGNTLEDRRDRDN